MSNGHGGYRAPAHPAPVSGPGAHSKRTDGQPMRALPDAEYGAGQEYQQLQRQAPLAGNAAAPAGQPAQAPVGPAVIPMNAPSLQPGVPVTAGAAYGPGPGPEALGQVRPNQLDAQEAAKYMPFLVSLANKDDTPASVKRLVRTLLANS